LSPNAIRLSVEMQTMTTAPMASMDGDHLSLYFTQNLCHLSSENSSNLLRPPWTGSMRRVPENKFSSS
jgi:hypothetical protein